MLRFWQVRKASGTPPLYLRVCIHPADLSKDLAHGMIAWPDSEWDNVLLLAAALNLNIDWEFHAHQDCFAFLAAGLVQQLLHTPYIAL